MKGEWKVIREQTAIWIGIGEEWGDNGMRADGSCPCIAGGKGVACGVVILRGSRQCGGG